MRRTPTIVLLIFIFMTCLNWIYVLWVKYLFYMLVNAWFFLLPLTGFFYFTFAFIAGYGLLQQKKFGLTLAYGVILFGSICAAISYMLVYNQHVLIDSSILPLLLLNFVVVIYLGMNRKYFQGE